MEKTKLIRTGILGGTFDPIHKSHIEIAQMAKEALELDEIWLLPDGDPPHKKTNVSGEERLEMTRLAIEGLAGFSVLDMEVRRAGTTYTIDTLLELQRTHPQYRLTYIIGGDTLYKIETWRTFERIAPLCDIAVIARAGTQEEQLREYADMLAQKYGFCIWIVPGGGSAISSSEIRRRLARGLSVDGFLPVKVERYIERKKLYRDERIERLRSVLTPARFRHTLGVEEMAIYLAGRFGADAGKAAEAALFHDCAKCSYTHQEMLEICERGGVELLENEREIAQILHAPAGAVLAKEEYGVTDEEVLAAIRWHTTGRKGLTLLEKIVFLADAIEPYRKPYPGLDKIRELARDDLDAAICQSAQDTQAYVAARGLLLNPCTAQMLEELEAEKK
ncbi:MAG: nicotinate-nucleotide adenylyltransferase [Eubacteriales bacterium]|nr:nicotinate-nucleotide adenylyltransferase [Eubacteriales bacterium]